MVKVPSSSCSEQSLAGDTGRGELYEAADWSWQSVVHIFQLINLRYGILCPSPLSLYAGTLRPNIKGAKTLAFCWKCTIKTLLHYISPLPFQLVDNSFLWKMNTALIQVTANLYFIVPSYLISPPFSFQSHTSMWNVQERFNWRENGISHCTMDLGKWTLS